MDISTIIAVVSVVFTIAVAYFTNFYKGRTNSFKSIIEANESFRDEVRKDLAKAKKELDDAGDLIEQLNKEVAVLRQKVAASDNEIHLLRDDLNEIKQEKEDLINKISNYEAEIKELQITIGRYETQVKDQQLVIDRLERELGKK